MSTVTPTVDRLPPADHLRRELRHLYARVRWTRTLIRLAERVDRDRQPLDAITASTPVVARAAS
ncbi:MAG: hypothetical protein U0871_13645 [Gemmataceae bacterium]